MTPVDRHSPLFTKELAAALRRSRSYVQCMKARGFKMPGGKATLAEADSWIARNPPPCSEREFKTAA